MAHLSETSISSDMENGLRRQSENPRSKSSSLLQLPEAVVTIIGMILELPTLEVRSSSNSSKPFISGIFKSVRSRLYSFRRIISISSATSVQVSQCIPSCAYISFSIRRSTLSLSMATISWSVRLWWICVLFIRSGNSSADCMGISTVKRLPLPFSLFSWIVPPSIVTMRWTMERPNPKPSFAAAFDKRSNAPNTRCCSSSVIPEPVSLTISFSIPLSYPIVRETAPFSVNLMAFDSRLFPICRMRSLSVSTTASVWFVTVRASPLFMAIGINSDSSVCAIDEILHVEKLGCSLPSSSRKKLRRVLSISRIRSEDCWIFRIYIPVLSALKFFCISPA